MNRGEEEEERERERMKREWEKKGRRVGGFLTQGESKPNQDYGQMRPLFNTSLKVCGHQT